MLTKAEIARLRSLQEKKHREALGLFVIEGEKVVRELLSTGFPFAELYATAAWAAKNVIASPGPILISTAEMARISHFPTPSSIVAVGRIERPSLDPRALKEGLTLALDGIQDPGNLGTLLRIADWFGLARVLLSPDCADLFHQKVINASMGSFTRVRVVTTPLPSVLASSGVPILGCDLRGENLHTFPPQERAIFVIGSEGRGLSAEVRALVTRFVTIPRYGAAESLNAAVAAAIVCDRLRHSQAPA